MLGTFFEVGTKWRWIVKWRDIRRPVLKRPATTTCLSSIPLKKKGNCCNLLLFFFVFLLGGPVHNFNFKILKGYKNLDFVKESNLRFFFLFTFLLQLRNEDDDEKTIT